METNVIYCADIGSVARKRFGWARGVDSQGSLSITRCTDIRKLVARVAQDLNAVTPVAMGFECPLFVPVEDEPSKLTRARVGDGSRAWSAAAGAGALATGLTEVLWVLQELRSRVSSTEPVYVSWPEFAHAGRGLFLWEAFVTSTAKGESDMDDAETAVRAFWRSLPNPEAANAIHEMRVHSLLGAALLRSGWSKDLGLLEVPCLVIKA
jgi:hypothetical protein